MSELISSFYLPVTDGKLLLPNVSVAEVLDYQQPEPGAKASPDYILGTIRWRGLSLPVVSFERANQREMKAGAGARIAVINTVSSSNDELPFFALVTQGIPRLVKITEAAIETLDGDLGPAQSALVRVDGEDACIPNIDYLEQLIKASC